jgi:excinuclease ABC subunit A
MQVERYKIHDIELVVDRLIADEHSDFRLKSSLEIGLKVGDSTVMVIPENGESVSTYSTKYSCPHCGKSYDRLSPNNFSFNSRYGSCRECDGLGELETFDLNLLVPDKSISVADGAIITMEKSKNSWVWLQLNAFAQKHGISLTKPYNKLSEEEVRKIFYGDEDNEIYVTHHFGTQSKKYKQTFTGLISIMKNLLDNPPLPTVETYLGKFLINSECPSCKGDRLSEGSLNVFITKRNIADITRMDIEAALKYFETLSKKLTEREKEISKLILKEIRERLSFLKNVGLSYLNLARGSKTLSGGESQRIRLASQIGSQLVGITYVLDEPSIGLHQHDNYKLIDSLKNLRDLGNSVIVVEHDRSMIEESDWFIDIGPKAGVHGGEIIFSAEPHKLKIVNPKEIERSVTAQYLLHQKKIEIKAGKRKSSEKFLTLHGARGHNLKNVDLEIPLGKFVCIAGLSGSGKSSLINDTLYPILNAHFYNGVRKPLAYDSIEGLENIDKIIEIDQSPIGKTARSNPATYTGVFTDVRNFFAMLPEAKIRGYATGRFSFNVHGGRCEDCQGAGIKKIEMNFLPDIYVPCDTCLGKRYNEETQQVKYKHLSIADVLDCTIEEALEYFTEIPQVKRKLGTLKEVGLGYIKLGQQSPTLSGGEAQRVKLATELSKRSTGKTLYLLDEPTTGLHFEDIRVLLDMLDKLVEKGNTVVVIEHNMDVIKFADWVIDMGPEGGDKGGYIIAKGTPQEIADNPDSLTGIYLKREIV